MEPVPKTQIFNCLLFCCCFPLVNCLMFFKTILHKVGLNRLFFFFFFWDCFVSLPGIVDFTERRFQVVCSFSGASLHFVCLFLFFSYPQNFCLFSVHSTSFFHFLCWEIVIFFKCTFSKILMTSSLGRAVCLI